MSEEAPLGLRSILSVEDVRARGIGLDGDGVAHPSPQTEKYGIVRYDAVDFAGQLEGPAVLFLFDPSRDLRQGFLASPMLACSALGEEDEEGSNNDENDESGTRDARSSKHPPHRGGFCVNNPLAKGGELVLELDRAREAIRGVFLQCLEHDPLELARHVSYRCLETGRILAQDCRERLGWGRPRESGDASEHLVEHTTEGEHVAGRGSGASLGLLG